MLSALIDVVAGQDTIQTTIYLATVVVNTSEFLGSLKQFFIVVLATGQAKIFLL
jgi:hypothetical protein